jgi:hypothetical protein
VGEAGEADAAVCTGFRRLEPRLSATAALLLLSASLRTVRRLLVPVRVPNPDPGGGQRPLPCPPRTEDELPLVSEAVRRAEVVGPGQQD